MPTAAPATMTAARAIIKVNGIAVGFMKNLRCSENKQRGSVTGLGRVTKLERPLTAIACTWNCDFYTIDLLKTGLPGAENRQVQTTDQYIDTQLLLQTTIDVYVYKKDIGEITGGVVTAINEKVFCVLRDVSLDNTSWDISEGQVSGLQQSGEYLQPVILAI